MSRSKLGKRHRCFQCSCAFFDLGKNDPICPRCGADQRKAPKTSVLSRSKSSPKKIDSRTMADMNTDEDIDTDMDDFESVDMDDDDMIAKDSVDVADDD